MKRMSPEAKVGLLVLAALLILAYMSLKLGKIGFGPEGGYRVSLTLDSAVGLTKDARVLVAGIPVGLVEDIRLEDGRAVVILRVRSDVPLPADTVGSLRTQGVLGEKYVELVPGKSPRLLKDGDRIRAGKPPGDLDRLVATFNQIADDVKRVTERLANVIGTPEGEQNLRELVQGLRDTAVGLRGVVADNREALRETVVNLRTLTADLRDLVAHNRPAIDEAVESTRSLTRTLADRAPAITENLERLTGRLDAVVAENRDDLRASLANLRRATGRLDRTLVSVQSLVEAAGSPEGTLGRLIRDDGLYEDLQGAVADLRSVLGRLDRGEGTLGKLLTDDAAYTELADSLGNIRSITEKIDRGQGTIGKLVNDERVHNNLNETLEGITDFVSGANRFRIELGYRGEYLAGLGESKDYFHVTLQPRQDRFYYLALVDDPRGDVETKTTERVITDETGTHTVTERKTVTTDKYKFSAQVGKRFSFVTLRGGLFESTGGVGADLDFFSDRLRLTLEAFDFSRDEGPPHLKASARWTFLRHLFVTAGLDDFLDDKGRADYFVGGGLTFWDEDIKFLLSPAAGMAK